MNEMEPVAPAPRMPLQLDVEFRRSYARRGEWGRIKNISLSGAFLELDAEQLLLPNDKVVLNFTVSGRKRRIQASVVWNDHHGCGVKFHHVNGRDQQIVDDLMYFAESSKETQRSVLDTIFKKVS